VFGDRRSCSADYHVAQVLAAVFPLLKADWGLSDGRLGAGGAVA
jgi:hypothetical protein